MDISFRSGRLSRIRNDYYCYYCTFTSYNMSFLLLVCSNTCIYAMCSCKSFFPRVFLSKDLFYFKEKNPWKAEIVVVAPTANNGYPEMVPLQHGKVRKCIFKIRFSIEYVFRIRMIIVKEHGLYFKKRVIYMMKVKRKLFKQSIIHYRIPFIHIFNQKVIKHKMKLIREHGILDLISKAKSFIY